jgi:hypothetical protein
MHVRLVWMYACAIRQVDVCVLRVCAAYPRCVPQGIWWGSRAACVPCLRSGACAHCRPRCASNPPRRGRRRRRKRRVWCRLAQNEARILTRPQVHAMSMHIPFVPVTALCTSSMRSVALPTGLTRRARHWNSVPCYRRLRGRTRGRPTQDGGVRCVGYGAWGNLGLEPALAQVAD